LGYNPVFQIIFVIVVAVGIGCATPSTSPPSTSPPSTVLEEAAEPSTAESSTTETEADASGVPKSDNFDKAEGALFDVSAPHKSEGGMLHLQVPQEETILLSSLENISDKEYTVSAEVLPPGVGEHVGVVFASRGEKSRGIFYLYRAAGADPFGTKCSIGLDAMIAGRQVRNPTIQVRTIDFKKDTPIKLSVRQVGQNVILSIDGTNVGRFLERRLKAGKVGVYGKSQHRDGSNATVKFNSFGIE
jgi:hypothetical protein